MYETFGILKVNNNINIFQDICNGISECEHSEIRINLTRMFGTLALILNSKSPVDPSDVEVHIAAFLIDRLSKETEVWPLAELLDTIMDLFAEDETDRLAQKINLVEKLNEITPVVKMKVSFQNKGVVYIICICLLIIILFFLL